MRVPLQKILTEFRRFAKAHSQIASVEVKPITENTAKGLKYPLMWVDIGNISASFSRGQMILSVPVLMLDRIQRDFTDLESVLSEQLLKMDDFYTYYNDNECNYGFYFSDSANASPEVYQFDDLVAGYSMAIQVQVGVNRDENVIPV